MSRVQGFGQNGLARMEGLGAALGLRLRWLLTRSSLRRTHDRKDCREILRRPVPGDFRLGRIGNCARRADIPDGWGKLDEERLEQDSECEGKPRKSLVHPAIAKVCVASEFLGRRRAANERDQAGEEPNERSRLFQRQPRSRQPRRRVERNSYIHPLMQMSDLKQTEWPPGELYASHPGFSPLGLVGARSPSAATKTNGLKHVALMACRSPRDLQR